LARILALDVLAKKPEGVFLSNGPADPLALSYAIETTRALIGKVPIMGICLGHKIIGLALGGKRFRLKFGHHGCNHPVIDLKTKRVEDLNRVIYLCCKNGLYQVLSILKLKLLVKPNQKKVSLSSPQMKWTIKRYQATNYYLYTRNKGPQ
jgi:anthranilate/para-aminobenzoate synthase component II